MIRQPRSRQGHNRADGFSILELTVAMGIMMVVTGTMFSLLNPAQGSFTAQGEVADLQQRLRVAQDSLAKDLVMAGAGPYLGDQFTDGALNYYFAPVFPYRQGAVGDDGPGQYFSDRVTLFYVPSTTAQSTLNKDFTSPGGGVQSTLDIVPETDCPTNKQNLCGFVQSTMLLIVDGNTGNFDTFWVQSVNDPAKKIDVIPPPDSAATTYSKFSKVMQVIQRTYYLKKDTSAACTNPVPVCNDQLMSYDGSANADVPVVDHVVGLAFEYYGDQRPPTLRKPGDPSLDTTYGPKPVNGANCVFDATLQPILPVLGNGSNPNTLVKLTPAQLTDGPYCPDPGNANRWDADLLRIRKVGVTIRVEAAVSSLRGPASALFSHAGTSAGGNRWVPDQEIHFQISPRNLNLGR